VIGAILQIIGDEATSLANAPRNYVWQISTDDRTWIDLPETQTRDEQRVFRIHRLKQSHSVRAIRHRIDAAWSTAPVIREVEFIEEVDATIPFPEWIAAVSTVESPDSLNEASPFVSLAKRCPNTEDLQAQRLWMGRLDPKFVRAEPRPLAVFLSGNYSDWCQKNREHWRGIEQILKQRALPIWASCGGAQGLAILDTAGVDKPWDCPRCRDPKNPKLPVYTHIGHTGTAPCGTYDQNLAERGNYRLKIERADPALEGLPNPFESMESHVGQIEFVPPGWTRLVTNGPGALTENQLLKIDGAPIYAAQFHIEMKGSEESSRVVMTNFLRVSREFAANSR
jgi:hypothetical protein